MNVFTPESEHRRVRHFGRKIRHASPYLWFTAAQPAFEPDQCCPSQNSLFHFGWRPLMASCSSPNDFKGRCRSGLFSYAASVMGGNKRLKLLAAFLVIISITIEATSAELTPGQASADWMQGYGDRNKDCMEWTDTCVNCVRDQSSENFSCSNIGIACQPNEVTCVRRADEKAK